VHFHLELLSIEGEMNKRLVELREKMKTKIMYSSKAYLAPKRNTV